MRKILNGHVIGHEQFPIINYGHFRDSNTEKFQIPIYIPNTFDLRRPNFMSCYKRLNTDKLGC